MLCVCYDVLFIILGFGCYSIFYYFIFLNVDDGGWWYILHILVGPARGNR